MLGAGFKLGTLHVSSFPSPTPNRLYQRQKKYSLFSNLHKQRGPNKKVSSLHYNFTGCMTHRLKKWLFFRDTNLIIGLGRTTGRPYTPNLFAYPTLSLPLYVVDSVYALNYSFLHQLEQHNFLHLPVTVFISGTDYEMTSRLSKLL